MLTSSHTTTRRPEDEVLSLDFFSAAIFWRFITVKGDIAPSKIEEEPSRSESCDSIGLFLSKIHARYDQ
jgi:hypothetical protein